MIRLFHCKIVSVCFTYTVDKSVRYNDVTVHTVPQLWKLYNITITAVLYCRGVPVTQKC